MMKTDPTTATRPGPGELEFPPGHQGSRVALAILLMLNSFKGLGLTRAALQAFTEHPDDDIGAALIGLKQRRRVHCVGMGRNAEWHLAVPPRTAQHHTTQP